MAIQIHSLNSKSTSISFSWLNLFTLDYCVSEVNHIIIIIIILLLIFSHKKRWHFKFFLCFSLLFILWLFFASFKKKKDEDELMKMKLYDVPILMMIMMMMCFVGVISIITKVFPSNVDSISDSPWKGRVSYLHRQSSYSNFIS